MFRIDDSGSQIALVMLVLFFHSSHPVPTSSTCLAGSLAVAVAKKTEFKNVHTRRVYGHFSRPYLRLRGGAVAQRSLKTHENSEAPHTRDPDCGQESIVLHTALRDKGTESARVLGANGHKETDTSRETAIAVNDAVNVSEATGRLGKGLLCHAPPSFASNCHVANVIQDLQRGGAPRSHALALLNGIKGCAGSGCEGDQNQSAQSAHEQERDLLKKFGPSLVHIMLETQQGGSTGAASR